MTTSSPFTTSAYLAAVRELLPGIRDRAAATEQLGRVPEETIVELDTAGVLAALQPRRWGGHEIDPATFFQSVVLIGSQCASTGWVASVTLVAVAFTVYVVLGVESR